MMTFNLHVDEELKMKKTKKICKYQSTSSASMQYRAEEAALRVIEDEVQYMMADEIVICMLRLQNQAVAVSNAQRMNTESISSLAGVGLTLTPTGYAWLRCTADVNDEIYARFKLRDEMLEEEMTYRATFEKVRAYASRHGIHR